MTSTFGALSDPGYCIRYNKVGKLFPYLVFLRSKKLGFVKVLKVYNGERICSILVKFIILIDSHMCTNARAQLSSILIRTVVGRAADSENYRRSELLAARNARLMCSAINSSLFTFC